MDNIYNIIPTYTKQILKFTNNKNQQYENTSIINITIQNDILIETEHKITKRLIDNELKQIFPIIDNSINTVINYYKDTLRKRSYAKISINDYKSEIETYAIFVYYIFGVSHVLIQKKYRINKKSLLIYEKTDKLPIDIISEAIDTEKFAHKIVIEQSNEDKIISYSDTNKIINALNNTDPATDPVITIPLTDTLNSIILEFYYIIANKLYITKTSDDILSRLIWIILNL